MKCLILTILAFATFAYAQQLPLGDLGAFGADIGGKVGSGIGGGFGKVLDNSIKLTLGEQPLADPAPGSLDLPENRRPGPHQSFRPGNGNPRDDYAWPGNSPPGYHQPSYPQPQPGYPQRGNPQNRNNEPGYPRTAY